MSHADAISQAIADIQAFGLGPTEKVRAMKALDNARKFLRKNQSALRDSFAKSAISGAAFEGLNVQEAAQLAYELADAMMVERVKDRHRRTDEDQEEEA